MKSGFPEPACPLLQKTKEVPLFITVKMTLFLQSIALCLQSTSAWTMKSDPLSAFLPYLQEIPAEKTPSLSPLTPAGLKFP